MTYKITSADADISYMCIKVKNRKSIKKNNVCSINLKKIIHAEKKKRLVHASCMTA